MGTPVTERIDNAAPPLASPSIFVSMMPLMPICRLNSPPEFTASCPVIASITSSVSQGLTASRMSASSRINSSSMASLPAVSSSSHWQFCFFAAFTAFLATFTGLVLRGSSLYDFAPTCLDSVKSCSIAAGRCRSHAASMTLCLRLRWMCNASFAAVVVLPAPCSPASRMMLGGESAR